LTPLVFDPGIKKHPSSSTFLLCDPLHLDLQNESKLHPDYEHRHQVSSRTKMLSVTWENLGEYHRGGMEEKRKECHIQAQVAEPE